MHQGRTTCASTGIAPSLPRRATSTAASVLAVVLALLALPAAAAAATAPTLAAPDSGTRVTEGASISFRWSGSLQGASSELDRSYYRLEIARAEDVPIGRQEQWTSLENSAQTPAGENVQSVTIGVPSPGDYRWRVCAWGVQDPLQDNSLEQLPGGCSASWRLDSKESTTTRTVPVELPVESVTVVTLPESTIVREREREATPVARPIERRVARRPAARPVPEVRPDASFQPLDDRGSGESSAVQLSAAAPRRSEEGLFAGALDALDATIPIVPIPYWTLLLLAAALPAVARWRRSVVAMFDEPGDDREDAGRDELHLDFIQHAAREVKQSHSLADPIPERPRPPRVGAS